MAACTLSEDQLKSIACFMCLQPDQKEAVKTYLLAVIAGGTLDPGTLLESAKCFTCIQPNYQKAIQNSLLCQILGM